MTRVDENLLKSNFGEAFVSTRLSGNCLVRPVVSGTDIGIDLYCETVEDNTPHLHFWMQVKTGKQCRKLADGLRASCSFEARHLAYWKSQPVPVFAALVPVEWPVRVSPIVYIVDVTTYLVNNDLPKTGEQALVSDFIWKPEDHDAVEKFLRVTVPQTAARLNIMGGMVTHNPQLKPQYIQRFTNMSVDRHIDKILAQIRRTASFGVVLLHSGSTLKKVTIEKLKLLARISEQFKDVDDHWETFMAPALAHHKSRDFNMAEQWYLRAKQCILDDPDVKDDPFFQNQITIINSLIEKAKQGEDLSDA